MGGEIDCRVDNETNAGATDGDIMAGDNTNDGVDNEMKNGTEDDMDFPTGAENPFDVALERLPQRVRRRVPKPHHVRSEERRVGKECPV